MAGTLLEAWAYSLHLKTGNQHNMWQAARNDPVPQGAAEPEQPATLNY